MDTQHDHPPHQAVLLGLHQLVQPPAHAPAERHILPLAADLHGPVAADDCVAVFELHERGIYRAEPRQNVVQHEVGLLRIGINEEPLDEWNVGCRELSCPFRNPHDRFIRAGSTSRVQLFAEVRQPGLVEQRASLTRQFGHAFDGCIGNVPLAGPLLDAQSAFLRTGIKRKRQAPAAVFKLLEVPSAGS